MVSPQACDIHADCGRHYNHFHLCCFRVAFLNRKYVAYSLLVAALLAAARAFGRRGFAASRALARVLPARQLLGLAPRASRLDEHVRRAQLVLHARALGFVVFPSAHPQALVRVFRVVEHGAKVGFFPLLRDVHPCVVAVGVWLRRQRWSVGDIGGRIRCLV